MDEPGRWGVRRCVTLGVVLCLHLALFAVFVATTRIGVAPPTAVDAVQVLYLPPERLPERRADDNWSRHLSGNPLIRISPAELDALAPSMTLASTAPADDGGSGVDWAAEARRALQAYVIRKHQPPGGSLSKEPADENWWPAQHRAGEQYKPPNGDWIVWINDSCYQLTSSGLTAAVQGASLPQTICPQPAAGARAGAR